MINERSCFIIEGGPKRSFKQTSLPDLPSMKPVGAAQWEQQPQHDTARKKNTHPAENMAKIFTFYFNTVWY